MATNLKKGNAALIAQVEKVLHDAYTTRRTDEATAKAKVEYEYGGKMLRHYETMVAIGGADGLSEETAKEIVDTIKKDTKDVDVKKAMKDPAIGTKVKTFLKLGTSRFKTAKSDAEWIYKQKIPGYESRRVEDICYRIAARQLNERKPYAGKETLAEEIKQERAAKQAEDEKKKHDPDEKLKAERQKLVRIAEDLKKRNFGGWEAVLRAAKELTAPAPVEEPKPTNGKGKKEKVVTAVTKKEEPAPAPVAAKAPAKVKPAAPAPVETPKPANGKGKAAPKLEGENISWADFMVQIGSLPKKTQNRLIEARLNEQARK